MKKNIFIAGILSLATSLTSMTIQIPQNQEQKTEVQLNLSLAFAASGVCAAIVTDALNNEPTEANYADPILLHIHRQLFRFNRIETADVEMVFCHLIHSLKMSPDLASLPQHNSISRDGNTVTLDVTEPTEAFATTNAYQAKAVVSYNNNVFLTMWWSGNDQGSKGYLIQGDNPILEDGHKRLKYLQWDRSSSQQSIRVFSTKFKNTYLTETDSTSYYLGDRAHYARATYNTNTKILSGHSVEIRQGLVTNQLGCYRTMIDGTIGTAISAYRSNNGAPESLTSSVTDGSGMDGIANMEDSTTASALSSGTRDLEPASLPAAFDVSCNDVSTAANTGRAFDSNTINFDADPSTIFPN
jgi:hypothetical protein